MRRRPAAAQYPDAVPHCALSHCRGLADGHISEILVQLRQLGCERLGCTTLYQLVEAVRSELTLRNRPHGDCPVCLQPLDGCRFVRTPCMHFYHSQCFAAYLEHRQCPSSGACCPVCRSALQPSDCCQGGDGPGAALVDSDAPQVRSTGCASRVPAARAQLPVTVLAAARPARLCAVGGAA